MALEHLISKARDHFGIERPEDWQNIRPAQIRHVEGVGPKTLDQLRIYLAMRGLTLRDDATPTFWMKNLQTATIGDQISLVDTAETEAFTILIDRQEKKPWTFQGFKAGDRPLIVPIKWESLGPSHGDYTVAGCERFVHIERKSVSDALGTFLAHGERHDRWLRTMQFLAEIPYGHIIIEGSWGQCFANIKSRGKRSDRSLRSEFMGSVISWMDTYCIPFHFIDTPRLAERIAHRILKRGWRLATEQREPKPESAAEMIAEMC